MWRSGISTIFRRCFDDIWMIFIYFHYTLWKHISPAGRHGKLTTMPWIKKTPAHELMGYLYFLINIISSPFFSMMKRERKLTFAWKFHNTLDSPNCGHLKCHVKVSSINRCPLYSVSWKKPQVIYTWSNFGSKYILYWSSINNHCSNSKYIFSRETT